MDGGPLATARLAHRFQQALARGRRHALWRRLRRRPPHLASLDAALDGRPVGRRPARLEQVPLQAIRGSVGRAADYSADFLPLRASDEGRWVRVAHALEGPGLPPVRLLRYRGELFVDDGHHRISVLRASHTPSVNAEVIDLVDLLPPPPPEPVPATFAAGG